MEIRKNLNSVILGCSHIEQLRNTDIPKRLEEAYIDLGMFIKKLTDETRV